MFNCYFLFKVFSRKALVIFFQGSLEQRQIYGDTFLDTLFLKIVFPSSFLKHKNDTNFYFLLPVLVVGGLFQKGNKSNPVPLHQQKSACVTSSQKEYQFLLVMRAPAFHELQKGSTSKVFTIKIYGLNDLKVLCQSKLFYDSIRFCSLERLLQPKGLISDPGTFTKNFCVFR